MPDEPNPENTLRSIPEPRSQAVGDVPEAIRRRYYTEERGGPGLGFYIDARIVAPAFRDRGRELTTPRADPNAIRDMLEIARHRGWRSIEIKGSPEFRREAWLAGRAMGLEMWGYRIGDRDIQDLDRRLERRERGQDRHVEATARSQLRVVDAVVRQHVKDPDGQRRVMEAARARIADWLERGASFEPPRQRKAQLAIASAPASSDLPNLEPKT